MKPKLEPPDLVASDNVISIAVSVEQQKNMALFHADDESNDDCKIIKHLVICKMHNSRFVALVY